MTPFFGELAIGAGAGADPDDSDAVGALMGAVGGAGIVVVAVGGAGEVVGVLDWLDTF